MIHHESAFAVDEPDAIASPVLIPNPGPIPEPSLAPGGSPEPSQIPIPEGAIDLGRREVRGPSGRPQNLSDRESSLLRYMTENAGRVITRDEMLLRVWRLNPQRIITRTIDMHIVHLRAKLGDDPKHPKILLTVRGEGYVFTGKTRSENESETAVNPR